MATTMQFQARMDNARATGRRELDILRGVGQDVKTRFGLHAPVEPPNTRTPGLPFQRGSLLKEPLVIVGRTLDNVATHVQQFAAINRQTLSSSGIGSRLRRY